MHILGVEGVVVIVVEYRCLKRISTSASVAGVHCRKWRLSVHGHIKLPIAASQPVNEHARLSRAFAFFPLPLPHASVACRIIIAPCRSFVLIQLRSPDTRPPVWFVSDIAYDRPFPWQFIACHGILQLLLGDLCICATIARLEEATARQAAGGLALR